MENVFYESYDGSIQVDLDTLLISMWNVYIEMDKGGENKIFVNNKEFFENSFNNSFDAAWAVTLSGRWRWTDDYVFFSGDGYVTSFSHWDDERSPIDIEKINVNPLIDGLKKFNKKDKKRYVNNIPRAIHDALQEV